ncbi:MAG: hypothetical protein U9N42_01850 [Campylobacterota bacterium]|nr:hypothetical protein [Campylobacterota bacterium]
MIYKKQNYEIDLSCITRLYPAAILIVDSEEVQVSLEWAELKKDSIEVEFYALIFDFDALGEEITSRVMLKFNTQAELIDEMKEVSKVLN